MEPLFAVHSLVRRFLFAGRRYEEVRVNWFMLERLAASGRDAGPDDDDGSD